MIFQAFLVDSVQAENLVKQKIWQCQVSNSFEIGTVDLFFAVGSGLKLTFSDEEN